MVSFNDHVNSLSVMSNCLGIEVSITVQQRIMIKNTWVISDFEH